VFYKLIRGKEDSEQGHKNKKCKVYSYYSSRIRMREQQNYIIELGTKPHLTTAQIRQ